MASRSVNPFSTKALQILQNGNPLYPKGLQLPRPRIANNSADYPHPVTDSDATSRVLSRPHEHPQVPNNRDPPPPEIPRKKTEAGPPYDAQPRPLLSLILACKPPDAYLPAPASTPRQAARPAALPHSWQREPNPSGHGGGYSPTTGKRQLSARYFSCGEYCSTRSPIKPRSMALMSCMLARAPPLSVAAFACAAVSGLMPAFSAF